MSYINPICGVRSQHVLHHITTSLQPHPRPNPICGYLWRKITTCLTSHHNVIAAPPQTQPHLWSYATDIHRWGWVWGGAAMTLWCDVRHVVILRHRWGWVWGGAAMTLWCDVRHVVILRHRWGWVWGGAAMTLWCDVRHVVILRQRRGWVYIYIYKWIYGYRYRYIYIYTCIYVYNNQCTCPSMQGMCLCLVYHVCNTILT